MVYKILLVNENEDFSYQVQNHLEAEGFKTSIAKDGEDGLKKAINQSYDAIILDVILKKLNGFEILQEIRKQLITTPVLMLTGNSDDIDRIISFEIGADDYLSKPCSARELIARLKNIMQRASKKIPEQKLNIEYGNIFIDSTKRTVSVSGNIKELTNTEFNILKMLMKSPGQAFSKEELTEYALGRKFTAYDRSIDVHVSNLRNKLGTNEKSEDWIKTVRGFGYAFNVEVDNDN